MLRFGSLLERAGSMGVSNTLLRRVPPRDVERVPVRDGHCPMCTPATAATRSVGCISSTIGAVRTTPPFSNGGIRTTATECQHAQASSTMMSVFSASTSFGFSYDVLSPCPKRLRCTERASSGRLMPPPRAERTARLTHHRRCPTCMPGRHLSPVRRAWPRRRSGRHSALHISCLAADVRLL
jgi:hypothetical protein